MPPTSVAEGVTAVADRPRSDDRLASPGWVLLPLRLFLGATFVFAGAQKLADPNFLRAGSPSSIQSQLRSYAARSPIHGLIGGLTHHAVLVGLLIAFAELAVGVGTLLGLWSRVAAVGGALLSLGFLLTVSWHSHPYYFGPDIVFLFAWLPIAIAGDGGVLSVEAAIAREAHQSFGPAVDLDRRAFLATARAAAVVAGGVAVFGAMTAAVGRLVGTTTDAAGRASPALPLPAPSARPNTTTPPSTATPASSPPTSTTVPPGTDIGALSAVPDGGAATFDDPATGDPAVVLRSSNDVRAFSAVCTHAGCTVRYTGSDFACPCHGARFSATDGNATQGPAQAPLSSIPIAVGPDGHLYVNG
jgi:thiosulfate dehydrogenase [quinone] large subunit